MTTKTEILQYIKTIAAKQLISKSELLSAYDEGCKTFTPEVSQVSPKFLSLTQVLYYIGGIIVFLGFVAFVYQRFDTLSTLAQILMTLGSGLAAYLIAILLNISKKTEQISMPFFLIFMLVTPMGLFVAFDHLGYNVHDAGLQTLIYGIVLGITLFSTLFLRSHLFALANIFFGTCFFFSITNYLMPQYFQGNIAFFDDYRALITGFTYLLLGYIFSRNKHVILSGLLYGFGLIGFLGTALALGGWVPHQNIFWELIFPVLAFGTIFLSVYLKSKTFLFFGPLFLIFYIFKISAEYFSHSLGWPLALVIAGLVVIGISYFSLWVKRQYL